MRKLMLLVSSSALFTLQVWAQKVVTGKVTDEQGNGIPNASVSIKGTKEGTVTGNDGSFQLTLPANATTLIISSVSMQTTEVEVGSQNSLSVALKALDNSLNEVVVVAYGSQKKTNITGAVNTINGGEVAGKPFIITERRKELAFESDRLFDLNRLKMDFTRSDDPGAIPAPLSVSYADPMRIAPIPRAEIQANTNIAPQQNPGY